MALAFSCSFARAAIKHITVSYRTRKDKDTGKVTIERRPLTRAEQQDRKTRFAEVFHFSEKDFRENPHLAEYEITDDKKFNRNCDRLLDSYNRKWAGGQPVRSE